MHASGTDIGNAISAHRHSMHRAHLYARPAMQARIHIAYQPIGRRKWHRRGGPARRLHTCQHMAVHGVAKTHDFRVLAIDCLRDTARFIYRGICPIQAFLLGDFRAVAIFQPIPRHVAKCKAQTPLPRWPDGGDAGLNLIGHLALARSHAYELLPLDERAPIPVGAQATTPHRLGTHRADSHGGKPGGTAQVITVNAPVKKALLVAFDHELPDTIRPCKQEIMGHPTAHHAADEIALRQVFADALALRQVSSRIDRIVVRGEVLEHGHLKISLGLLGAPEMHDGLEARVHRIARQAVADAVEAISQCDIHLVNHRAIRKHQVLGHLGLIKDLREILTLFGTAERPHAHV